MAYAPATTAKGTPDGPYKLQNEEALDRLDGCERQKSEFDLDIREGYFFTAPHRAREIRSAQAFTPHRPADADTLQTGIAMEYSKDFCTVAVNSFMPPHEAWAEQRPGMFLDEAQSKEAKDEIAKQDPKIFDAIRASNLYEEVPKAFNPDLSIGTTALWIDDPRPSENVVVQAVPLHELEINVGPYGSLDDRFVVRHTKYRHIKALLGATVYGKIDAETRKDIDDPAKQAELCCLRWGYWRKWDRLDDVVWQHVMMLDRKVIHVADLNGVGSCPLIPMRFNPSPEWAMGAGPTIESLSDLRQLDELEARKIEHIDNMISPAMGFPSDSYSSIEGGVQSNTWYPIRPGDEGAIKRLMEPGTMEPAIYEVSEKQRQLRHRYFLDWPEQRGDTPPTATQWLDEMQLAQRRFGTPGASFWKEGPAEIFLRFKHILTARGLIAPVKVNGKVISLQPYNPAQRAAEQQEVAMAARYLSIVMPTFPEESKLAIDGEGTAKAMAEKMRVTGIVKFRTVAQKKVALTAIAQLMQGQPGQTPPPAAGTGQ